jgi:hypothetical protein
MLWVMSTLPCSICFTCHHEIPAKFMLAAHHACPCGLGGLGACMINSN